MLDRFPESYLLDRVLFIEPGKVPETAFTDSRGGQFFDRQYTDFLIRVAAKKFKRTDGDTR